ncbi:MAG: squalene-hopene/tetraprenyl-beta-curcumene cyclase [Candidatus Eremiobacteraeota bacterium]|nr:squalene-hopene/tetraprenyl-beta-curcumene cyclase [Candidatus Eremiobacteraeota bacterium]
MLEKLKTLQNADGGFRAFYTHDIVSGVWSTAEIVHLAAKASPPNERAWLEPACRYLLERQNPDGGWPFRSPGKSITDVTAWCTLGLAHFKHFDAVERGIGFILRARNNVGSSANEDGWGLTSFEQDRVYSTWIASYSLQRLMARHREQFSAPLVGDAETALALAKVWLRSVMTAEGGWPATCGSPAQVTSTAVALLTLFMQGDDPNQFRSSRDYLVSAVRSGLWAPENEIVVTQEGYELTQEWFTSALAFRALIFYAELGLVELHDIDAIFLRLIELVHSDGSVSVGLHASRDFIWTIPFMLDAVTKYERFIHSKGKLYAAFLDKQFEYRVRAKRKEMEGLLTSSFPYPVSRAFSDFQHELDHHRKFQLMVQVYDITMRYAALVGLSGYLLAKEKTDQINALLRSSFKRPSFGDWASLLDALLHDSAGFAKLLHPQLAHELTKPLHNYFDNSPMKLTLSQLLSSVVSLRNQNLGHGAVRTLYEYKLIIEEQEPKLYSFLDRFAFLAHNNSFLVLASEYDEFGQGDHYKIRIFKGLNISDSDLETASRLSEGQRDSMVRYVYFQNIANNTIVNLYPFVSYMFCDECKREQFFLFNSMKTRERVSYLSYSCGHASERGNAEHFRKRLEPCALEW